MPRLFTTKRGLLPRQHRALMILYSVVAIIARIQTERVEVNTKIQDERYVKAKSDTLSSRQKRGTAKEEKDEGHTMKESTNSAADITDELEWLSELSLSHCPMADFCHVQSTDFEALLDNEESCCKSCYCNETCGSTLNCCLEQFDLYKEVATYNLQCIRPIITFLNVSRVEVPNYYMVTECLSDLENNCMQKPVAKWGSFLPVFSKTEDKIFFNKHCAECNDVNDAKEWRLSLSCNIVSSYQLTMMGDLIEDALKGISCEIVFLPPKDTPVDKFICVKESINRCNVTGIWNQFNPVINEACETIYAPVRDENTVDVLFANIFCVICNNAFFNSNAKCPKFAFEERADPNYTTFSVMLDYEVVDSSKEQDIYRKSQSVCGDFEVNHPFKDECRKILCPTGYLRTVEGCKLYTSAWYMRGYLLYLDLQPTSQAGGFLTLNGLQSLSVDELKTNFDEVRLPVEFWLIYATTAKDSDKTEYVYSLSLTMGSDEFPVDVNQTLENIRHAIRHNMTIDVENESDIKSFSYKINFAKSLGRSDNYTLISITGSMSNPPLIITKLYICEQVRLWSGEWHDNPRNSIIVTLGEDGNGKVLQSLEYSRHSTETGDAYVQICVEDFNPNPKQYARSTAPHVIYHITFYFSLYSLCYLIYISILYKPMLQKKHVLLTIL